ncbi:hypothetical protein CBS101457_004768 [Exobasidium rhododendri]|nr:hypothetical protein CBS101457_004768 [Exobasidium rhododendri]
MAEEKVRVPFPSPKSPTSDIVGILRQQAAGRVEGQDKSSSTEDAAKQAKPVALILHGVLSHKDQLYHRRLAELLPIDSFRFDFRANAESEGEWGMGDFEKDLQDLHVVIKHLRLNHNYHVESIIGHSRGALIGWLYFSDLERRRQEVLPNEEKYVLDAIPYYVALSGRWRMGRIHDRDHIYEPAFAEEGKYTWNVRVAGVKVSAQIRKEDVDKFASFPIEEKVGDFPEGTDCLIMQGTDDKTVPSADAGYYLNKLNEKERRPGSTQLQLVDDADHNFRGKYDQVVDYICDWLQARKRGFAAGRSAEDFQERVKTAKGSKSRL